MSDIFQTRSDSRDARNRSDCAAAGLRFRRGISAGRFSIPSSRSVWKIPVDCENLLIEIAIFQHRLRGLQAFTAFLKLDSYSRVRQFVWLLFPAYDEYSSSYRKEIRFVAERRKFFDVVDAASLRVSSRPFGGI